MFVLKRFHGERLRRLNAIIDSLEGHVTGYINLVGSSTLPLPEVCQMEGLPGTSVRVEGHLEARLFPSTDPVDEAEEIIVERTRDLFGLTNDYGVSGQPHSATTANHVALRATLNGPGKTVACLSTTDGGHISHRFGAPPGTNFLSIPLTPIGIDYAALERAVEKTPPDLLIAGGTSYPLSIDYPRLREITGQIGCHLHADLAHTAPFVIAGLHPPVFPAVDSATIDTNKNLRGPSGGILVFRETVGPEMRRAIFPIIQSSPHPTGLLAKAACLETWTKSEMKPYAERMVRFARLLSGQLRPHLGELVFSGTDTHLLLLDLSPLDLDGRGAEERLDKARILVNRNQIPDDRKSPWVGSGIRLGSTVPAILGYSETDVERLGSAVASILIEDGDERSVIDELLHKYHRPVVSTASGST
jgi:glycine hydroxymethyltransferase